MFMTNEAKHERPTMSSFSFGSAVFTNSGMSDVAPGSNDQLVVRVPSISYDSSMRLICFFIGFGGNIPSYFANGTL